MINGIETRLQSNCCTVALIVPMSTTECERREDLHSRAVVREGFLEKMGLGAKL